MGDGGRGAVGLEGGGGGGGREGITEEEEEKANLTLSFAIKTS